jgi:AraC-like DNA-binding protein
MNDVHTKLFYSCTSEKYTADENVVEAHTITFIYEGSIEVANGVNTVRLEAGALFYTAKNTLFRFTKIAAKDAPFKSVTVVFTDAFLQEYFRKNKPVTTCPATPGFFELKTHKLWATFFQSLQPYVDMQHTLPEDLCNVKQQEAIGILRTLCPGIDHQLSNFSMPGKIDLEAFMQENYLFNLPLQRFAYLSGRSISTFKRDFFRIFQMTPQRWLTRKKLDLARYLIESRKIKPSQAFIDAGFENLSHFSRAFKKEFGHTPRQLLNV